MSPEETLYLVLCVLRELGYVVGDKEQQKMDDQYD